MRIVHVTHMLHPGVGGPATVAVNLAAAQARMGHSVAVMGHFPTNDRARSMGMVEGIPFEVPLEHHLIPLSGMGERLLGRGFTREAAEVFSRADIVVAHGVWDSTIVHAVRMARRGGVPYVIRPAGMLDPWCLRQKRIKKELALRLHYARLLGGAAFIHATSGQEARNILRLSARLGISVPAHVIPNGVFLNDIERMPEKGRFQAAHPELGGRRYVLFLGRLHHKKRPDLLVRAFAEARPAGVDLVLAGPDAGEEAGLRQLASELGVAERVHFPGPQYGAAKFEVLVDAACFCLASEQENFGIAVAEAMAASVPVIVSDQVHLWTEIQHAGAGLACPLEPGVIARALRQMLGDEAGRTAMGQAGRRLIEESFLWRKIAARACGFYEEVVGKAGAGTRKRGRERRGCGAG